MSNIGIRRDGSYYTRLEWANPTSDDPMYWAENLIDDDTQRNGGTWAANTHGPANAVLSFFGETQTISKIRIFHNVGLTISILEELASKINIYVSDTDECRCLKSKEDDINEVQWNLVKECTMKKEEGWQEFEIEPTSAKYVRIELEKNFNPPEYINYVETNEIKLYP